MWLKGWKRRLFASSVAALSVAILATSCSVGSGVGVGGAVVTLFVVLVLAGGTSATQTGCDGTTVEPCLSPPLGDTSGEPGDASDAGVPDAADADGETLEPCLSVRPPDSGQDADSSLDDASDEDAADDVGDGTSDGGETVGTREPDRREIIDRLEDRLPDDVVDRLSEDEETA